MTKPQGPNSENLPVWKLEDGLNRLYAALEAKANAFGFSFFEVLAHEAFRDTGIMREVVSKLFSAQVNAISGGEAAPGSTEAEIERLTRLREELDEKLDRLDQPGSSVALGTSSSDLEGDDKMSPSLTDDAESILARAAEIENEVAKKADEKPAPKSRKGKTR